QDRIPSEAVSPRGVGHGRDVAVRHGCDTIGAPQTLERAGHLRPSIETMPRQIERSELGIGKPGNAEPLEDALEVLPVEHIELAKRAAATPNVFKSRLILPPPSVGKAGPIDIMAAPGEHGLGL